MNDPPLSVSYLTSTQIAEEAIGLFLEYRDVHGYDEEQAKDKAVQEVIQAEQEAFYRIGAWGDERNG